MLYCSNLFFFNDTANTEIYTYGHTLSLHDALPISIEEGSVGGFGSQVMQFLAMEGLLDHGLKVRPMVLPDSFIDHDSPAKQYDAAGLNAPQIVAIAMSALGRAHEQIGRAHV